MAFGNANLLTHQIDAGDHLSDRVFHLEARVHFEEEEFPGRIDQKLDRAGPDVIAGARHFNGALSHLFTQGVVEQGRGRFLDHLLVSTLDAALPLKQMHRIAVRVAQHLNLNVTRLLHQGAR